MGKGYTFKKKGKGPVSAPMQELIRKLKEDPSQLDSSGFGTHMQVNVDSDDTKRRNRSTG